jgi:5-methylcytosine-specific restriction endonuclease McrA
MSRYSCEHGYRYPYGEKNPCPICLPKRRSEIWKRKPETKKIYYRLSVIFQKLRGRRETTVTIDGLCEIWDQQNGECAYCGTPMTYARGGRTIKTVSVDRIIFNEPYHRNNIVLACWACNSGKGLMTPEEYIEHCKRVIKHNS